MSDVPKPLQHRELSRREADDLVHAAFTTERKIKTDIAAIHADTWALAGHLYDFHELHGWTLLGYETLEEFLAQPEVGMSRRWFFQLVRLWRDLVGVKKVQPAALAQLEVSKVAEVMPAIMSGTIKAEDALADAEALGKRDLREKYGLASRGADTPLAAEEEPIRTRCQHCEGSGWITEAAP